MKKQRELHRNYINNDKAVTLIALAITIVVAIILAGVAVNQMVNGDGFLHSVSRIESDVKENLEKTQGEINEIDSQEADIQAGATNTIAGNTVNFALESVWTTQATVTLSLDNYEFKDNSGINRAIDKIYYACRKESDANYQGYLEGDTALARRFTYNNLIENTSYVAIAVAEYTDDSGNAQTKVISDELHFSTPDWGFEVGDWVNYDAGVWTQSEIDTLKSQNLYFQRTSDYTLEGHGYILPNKFYGYVAGTSKNTSRTTSITNWVGTGVSVYGLNNDGKNNVTNTVSSTVSQGWRVLGITEDNCVLLVSAGMPEYCLTDALYLTMGKEKITGELTIHSYYLREAALTAFVNRTFEQYVNSTYASEARMMTYQDVLQGAKFKTNMAKIGATYLVNTVKYDSKAYPTQMALSSGVYGKDKSGAQIMYYQTGFCEDEHYSAGQVGIRVVVKLKPEYIASKTDANGQNAVTGKTYSDPLYIIQQN